MKLMSDYHIIQLPKHFKNSITFSDFNRAIFHRCVLLDDNSPWISSLIDCLSMTLHILQIEALTAFCYKLSFQGCPCREKSWQIKKGFRTGAKDGYVCSPV